MAYVFEFDPARCSACGACAVACMDQNDIDIKHLEEPFRVTCAMERAKNEFCQITFMSVACNHCEDAPCIAACPCGWTAGP